MYRKNADLFVVIALSHWSLVAILSGFLRVIAVPLVLVLPGYALLAALSSRRTRVPIQGILLTLALSIVIVILAGLALNLLPWGLQTRSWLPFLYGFTMFGCIVALYRRMTAAQPTPHFSFPPLPLRQIGLLGIALVLTVLALTVSRNSALQQQASFTQLWMLPIRETPYVTAQIGIQNAEARSMTYDLIVMYGTRELQRWSALTVNAGATWTDDLSLPPNARDGSLEAVLYRRDNPQEAYRRVRLWLDGAN